MILSQRLVPDDLWVLVEPLIPPARERPQGGGRARTDPRAVFTAIVFVLTSGCAWRHLPPSFGVSVPTAHRTFTEWTEAGLWRQVHQSVLDELGGQGLIDWSRAVLDGAPVRAKWGQSDRSESGRSRQARFEDPRAVRPGRLAVDGRDLRGQHPRQSRAQATGQRAAGDPIPPGPRRRKPAKLHADKAYDIPALRDWLRQRQIIPRIARKSIESTDKLGKHRWVIERSIAWLTGYRRLTLRYEHKPGQPLSRHKASALLPRANVFSHGRPRGRAESADHFGDHFLMAVTQQPSRRAMNSIQRVDGPFAASSTSRGRKPMTPPEQGTPTGQRRAIPSTS
ncbi:transposase [Saccharomonospora amisosensis]|uniref:Transposase n=1 Tax=Saccharomonospora amisosensis TaxID=1128677 RepID=A0A7X5ZQW9_9PSEU|nr:transposase [Saccharomonospora amisosensis]